MTSTWQQWNAIPEVQLECVEMDISISNCWNVAEQDNMHAHTQLKHYAQWSSENSAMEKSILVSGYFRTAGPWTGDKPRVQ